MSMLSKSDLQSQGDAAVLLKQRKNEDVLELAKFLYEVYRQLSKGDNSANENTK